VRPRMSPTNQKFTLRTGQWQSRVRTEGQYEIGVSNHSVINR
jgi:hypothetical protein